MQKGRHEVRSREEAASFGHLDVVAASVGRELADAPFVKRPVAAEAYLGVRRFEDFLGVGEVGYDIGGVGTARTKMVERGTIDLLQVENRVGLQKRKTLA